MFIAIFEVVYNSLFYSFSLISYTWTFFHSVLPYGMDVAALGVSAYFLSRLPLPCAQNVLSIFGPLPGTKEFASNPEKVVTCIAHRGACFDAPENTMHAFKYCIEQNCNFIELDVRSSRDGQLVALHDRGLQRLAGTNNEVTDVRNTDWASINKVDVGISHPNRDKFKEVNLCLLEDALQYLLKNNAKVIIDVKGQDAKVIDGVLKSFKNNAELYQCAAVTTFNPYVLYQIRKRDPKIVGAISYRPYGFSAGDYDADHGPTNVRFPKRHPANWALRAADMMSWALWRRAARWCGVSAVLVHKDIVSPMEIKYWNALGAHCIGWCVNRPVEKLYWRQVLQAPYLSNTLLGEPEFQKVGVDERSEEQAESRNEGIESHETLLLRNVTTGQN